MIKIIDIDEKGLSTEQLLQTLGSPGGAILRRDGQVVGRIEPADEIDLEDEIWARAPEQIERGRRAREEFVRGETIPEEEVRRELGLD